MQVFILTLILVFAAEVGDKTQILAMAYGKNTKVRELLTGVFLGVAFSYGFSVLIGQLLGHFLPEEGLSFIAGLLFVLFGLLSLSVAEHENKWTVPAGEPSIFSMGWSFFKGELGDKTQLVTLTLAAYFQKGIPIWSGAVLGTLMITALGIFAGRRFGSRIPEYRLRLGAFVLFFSLGTYRIATASYVREMGTTFIVLLMGILLILTAVRGIIFSRQIKEISISVLKQEAEGLMRIKGQIETELCNNCAQCQGDGCAVKCMVSLLEKGPISESNLFSGVKNIPFDAEKAQRVLEKLQTYAMAHPEIVEADHALKKVERLLKQVALGDNVIEKNTMIDKN